jgi:predicted TIM-barrel fold metal-dependent hydrolase
VTDTQALVDEALVPIVDEVARLRPGGAYVIDVHTHLGLDEDGMTLDPEGLIAMLDQVDAQQAVAFPLHDPERSPAYRLPNDRVLEWAAGSEGRLIPFCRLDPAEEPVAEAERCLALGARGIKLHPRAQAFGLAGQVEPIFKLAEEAHVPILIHAGRGLPDTFAAELVDVADKHPGAGLIMAHVGVADQAVMGDGLRDHPRAVFDSSWLSTVDMISLFTRVPAERIAFGSDPPYGRTLTGLFLLLRTAACLGISPEVQRHMLGGAAQRLIADEELLPATAPPAPQQLLVDARLLRLHTGLMLVFGSVVGGTPALEMLELARRICMDPAAGPAEAAFQRILPLLDTAKQVLTLDPEFPRRALLPVVVAMAIAATEVPQQRS